MDPLATIRQLRAECSGFDVFETALATIATLINNVLEHPEEEKYRTVRLSNPTFHQRVGQFGSAIDVLRTFGFEDATRGDALSPTHLALPEADPVRLAQGLVLVEAARQASTLVSTEQKPPAAFTQPVSATGSAAAAPSASSRASGKRPIAAVSAGASKRPALSNGPPQSAAGEVAAAGVGSSASAPQDVKAPAEDQQPTHPPIDAVELESYTASAIDGYFVLQLGENGTSLPELSFEAFSRLVESARDARRVAAATTDADAEARAVHWLGLLAEHGALCGWGGGAEEEEEVEADPSTPADAATATLDGHAVDGSCAQLVADDGNFDACGVCGLGGLLICCEACPQAYHRECLGDHAPPEDDDDDSAWFCPEW